MNNKDNENKEYCVISKEIVVLLEWLITQDSKLIENLIKKVWKRGFSEMYLEQKNQNFKFDEYIAQQTVLDFFSLIDNSLDEVSKTDIVKKQKLIQKSLGKNLSLFLEKNDFCNDAVEKSLLSSNVEHILQSNILEKDEQKSLFLKQFLKNWDSDNSIIE